VGDSFRVAAVQGRFDLPKRDTETFTLHADVPIETVDWQVGAIVGASGSGKSILAAELWPEMVSTEGSHEWGAGSIVDDFPEGLSASEVVDLLTGVGFSSVPAWLRPYSVLSTGQRFRADLARSLADLRDGRTVIFDEFTSTVDRTVAKAAATATGKLVRRAQGQFVAVTCHKDVLPWLAPDWTYDTDAGQFTRRSVQPRPPIRVCLRTGSRDAWRLFKDHHYMTQAISPNCRIILAYVQVGDEPERLAGFWSAIPSAGHKGWWRGHRIVVMPDFQGLGIGNRMIEECAEWLWTTQRKRYREVTSAPGIVHHRRKHPYRWRLAGKPYMASPLGRTTTISNPNPRTMTSAGRLTTRWVYIPAVLRAEEAQ
jgi:GNAT superfamily N-acetyltransferase